MASKGKGYPLSNVPEDIESFLAESGGSEKLRAIFNAMVKDLQPRRTMSYSIVWGIANIELTIRDLQKVRAAILDASKTDIIEQCLKDSASDDPAEHVRYVLRGARQDAMAYATCAATRERVDGVLARSNYSRSWIEAQAYKAVMSDISAIDREIAFHEERRKRLLSQLFAFEAIAPDPLLIEGPVGGNA